MKSKKLLMLFVILVAVALVTQNVAGDTGNPTTVEITQVKTDKDNYYEVKITDLDGLDVVHLQIRSTDGVLLWDSGFKYPEGAKEFRFIIPRDVVFEHLGYRDRLQVKITDTNKTRPTHSLWETPEWNFWEPPIGSWESLTVININDSVGGIQIPVDKFDLLAPYIALASIILVATAIYFKRVKHRKEVQ